MPPHFEQVGRDVRYGLRQLRRNLGFSAIAIATLALGIGVNTAMFSAVDAMLIRPLPYVDAGRLVALWDDLGPNNSPRFFSTPPEWSAWRNGNTVFTDIAATDPGRVTLSGDGEPEELQGRRATGNLWSVLGVKPLLGRVFNEEEDKQGRKVAVISHGLWQRRFGGSPDAIGKKIFLNDTPYEVIGVMPRDFYFMPARNIDVWMPTSWSAEHLTSWYWHDLNMVARLKPSVTLAQARQEMSALANRVSAEHVKPARSAVVLPLREELAGKTRTSLIVLLTASAAVLLIACVNLANLLLSRGQARRREVALRAALGATRGRLVTQFLTESLVLAGLGALAGLAVAKPALRYLETLIPDTMGAQTLSLDWRVLLFSAATAVVAGITFGLVPAIGVSQVALEEGLKEAGRGTAGGRSQWFQHSLVVTETALAVVLLTTGGLLLQTFQHLRQLDLGMKSEKLLTFVTPLFRYRDFDQRVSFVDAQLEAIKAIPGVVDAAATSRVPLTVNDQSTFYLRAGQPPEREREQIALTRVVTREYFATVGARRKEGRFFDVSDRKSDAPVAVINEAFANKNYPGRSPLGERFKFGRTDDRGYWYTVVGVVKDIRERGVAEELHPAVYRVHEQSDQTGDPPSGIVVRTAVEPATIIAAVRRAIGSVDKNEPVARIQTIEDIVNRQLSGPTQSTALLGAFAVLALLLASIGLYGVLSYAVSQRTKEIGLRIALGATTQDILMSFTRRGLALTLTGLAMGVVLAALAARLMTALFYGFEPGYGPAIAVVSMLLLVVAALACLVPARRASRIDPTVALQHE